MSKDIYGLTNEANREKVDEIRAKFLSDVDKNGDMYDPIDVHRVRTEDWQIERFVLALESVDKAYEALIKTLRWKKSFGLHSRSHSYFPKEFLMIFGFEKFSYDSEGRPIKWSISQHFKKIPDFYELTKNFIAYQIEVHDRAAGNRGFVSVNSLKGAGFGSIDMSLVSFSIELMDYYPEGPKMSYSVDLPWILNGLFKIALALIPKHFRNNVHIISLDELADHFDAEIIPVSFGGKRETCYEHIHDMKPLRDCIHLGFNDKQINKFYDTYKDLPCID